MPSIVRTQGVISPLTSFVSSVPKRSGREDTPAWECYKSVRVSVKDFTISTSPGVTYLPPTSMIFACFGASSSCPILLKIPSVRRIEQASTILPSPSIIVAFRIRIGCEEATARGFVRVPSNTVTGASLMRAHSSSGISANARAVRCAASYGPGTWQSVGCPKSRLSRPWPGWRRTRRSRCRSGIGRWRRSSVT